MAQKDDFKVFQGNYIPGDGAPVVLVFACSDKGKLYSVYFIFVQDSEGKFYKQGMPYEEIEIPAADIIIDINFMMDYALESAKAQLKDHLYQKYEKKKEGAYLYHEYILVEDRSAMVRLCMSDRYSDQLKMIREGMRHYHKLYKFIDGIISIPKIIPKYESCETKKD